MRERKAIQRRDSAQFAAACEALLERGAKVRFRANGRSMRPNILNEDAVIVAPTEQKELRRGDVAFTRGEKGFRVHRVRFCDGGVGEIVTRGDAGQENDTRTQAVLGKVTAIARDGQEISFERPWIRQVHAARAYVYSLRLAMGHRMALRLAAVVPALILVQLFAGATAVKAVNVTLTQTPSVTTVSPGGTVTYTNVLTNNSGLNGVVHPVITMATPNSPANNYTTFASVTVPAGWSCTNPGVNMSGTVTCTDSGTLAAGANATMTLVVNVLTSDPGQTVLNGSATVTSATTALTGTTTATSTVTVLSADLAVTESVTPTTINPGGTLTFSSSITNNGSSTAAAPQLTFVIPTNTTYVSYTTTGGITCAGVPAGGTGTLTCTFSASLASGGTATINIVVMVNSGTALGTVITGSATISSVTYDPNSANNTSSITALIASADLSAGISAAAPDVAPSGTITYSIVTKNNGPSAAAAPQMVFATPTNTVFLSSTPPSGTTCAGVTAGNAGTLTCNASASLANGGSSTIVVTVTVNAGVALGTVITGSATVSSATYDPNSANNTASTTTTVAGADLTMSQTTSVSVVDTGINFNYTEIATNNGPAGVPAGTLVVYQQTPPNTTLQSITVDANWNCPSPGATGPIICTYAPALASGANTAADPIVFTLSVNTGTTYGTTILNSATVTSQTFDPVPSNNTSLTTVSVEPAAQADLALSMTAAPTPAFLSSTLNYTIEVQNLGQASAATVQVKDTIPAGTAFLSASGPAGWTCSTSSPVTCSLTGTMAEGASATITISVTTPATSGPISNTATVSSTTTDPVAANNSATVVTVVQPLVCATPGKDGPGGIITGVVNTYYPGSGTLTAGGTASVTLGAASGSAKTIGIGDLILIIQMQDSLINSTNTSSYGHGTPGDPATGSTNLQSSGLFEYVTATSAVPAAGGLLTFAGTGANGGTLNTYTDTADSGTAGAQTFQVIRVPQYTSATLSSGLAPLAWNGSVGGVLAIDVASQVTLGGTVAADALGFRGGGGITARGAGTGADTDYVTTSPAALPVLTTGDAPNGSGANGSKGEGIAGAPHWISPATSSIVPTSTAVSTAQTTLEGLPNGSYARGAPGNAGGGGTDGHPAANDQNSGGGAGGNGGTGGLGGYGWNSFTALNSTDGGFGGLAFPATTSAIVMGGGGGAGTTNNGSYYISGASSGADCGTSCTGVYSSGGAGGGIVIVHTGSVAGTGTITSNGQSTLNTLNDSTGGGGGGGTVIFFANTNSLPGLTVNANGGNGGTAWLIEAPGAFPGARHGPGGGGGGGVVLLSGTPTALSVAGGSNGYTDTIQDSYGATPGQTGVSATNLLITETPGTQSGAYCASADLLVTNSGTPNPVLAGPGPGNVITYTQTVTNNGPFDALNAVFGETIPANTTFQSLTVPGGSGWTCTTPSVGGTGAISCTNPDDANAASTTFTVAVAVNSGVAAGTVITDVANATSGTNDPNLANNSATVQTTVGLSTTADLSITNANTPNPVIAGNNITYTVVVTNNGAAAASTVAFSEAIPANTTFVSATPSPATGWTCSAVSGTLTCSNATLAAGASATFTVVVTVASGTASGTVITDTANVSSTTTDPNPNNNSATVTDVVATATQADLSVASAEAPNPVTDGNNITYTQGVTNNGPAASGTATFTDAIPTGTSFVSFTVPTGWSCGTLPTVGSTGGTITCSIASVAVNASYNFPLVVKASLGDTPGTAITNTAYINNPCSSVTDPNCGNNTATTTVYIASPTQADLAITKTANPDPVDQGTNLEYTLQVTNNGPASATGVTVSDPLPSQVTYSSVSTTQGTCNYTAATATVSCTLGTVNVGGLVVIAINAMANTFTASTQATNTATVSATTSDPDPGNNTASFTSTIAAPTAVQLASFRAMPRQGGGVLVEWKTREEIRNLGFNVYRLDGQGRQRLNPSIIAGSALLIRGGRPQHAAKTYQYFDPSGTTQSTYELEDVDLNGTRMPHGPVSVDVSVAPSSGAVSQPLLLTQLNRATVQPAFIGRRGLHTPLPVLRAPAPGQILASLDGYAAVKISVQSEGWYQVSKAQLVTAGLDPYADVRTLQLYAEGVEQPMLILGGQAGPLGANEGIEFYGISIDTPFSDARVYWLIQGSRPGLRIHTVPAANGALSGLQSFPFTVVLEQRTTYFVTLLNGENNDNFFGAAVTSEPVDQQLTVAHLDPSSSMPITVDIQLQGATDQQAHSVSVFFNGASIGEMDFANLANVTNTLSIDHSLLQNGVNTVTLTALEGDNDISVVQSIALHYPHTYDADANWLKATAPGGSTIHVGSFTNQQIQVFDITNPLAIEQLSGTVQQESGSYGITVSVPPATGQDHTLLVFSGDQVSPPSGLAFHAPAALASPGIGSQMVIITHPDFQSALGPLVSLHESRGQSVKVVSIDEVFDAFNYGERSPFAIRDFLQNAESVWTRKPQYLLLVGDASLDPRNYLGLGDFDFVPTRIIETSAFKTASDDWFSDFDQTGFETIATGRLPVRTASDAALVVSKIVNFEKNLGAGGANQQALLVADQNVGADFTTATKFAATNLPSWLQPTEILADGMDPSVVSQQIFTALNSGPLLVNYSGHGAVEQWSFEDLLDDTSAATLTNSNQLSVYLLMDCLNGFFQDVYSTSLAETLLLAPNGGAVAVWASSGFTNQPPQASMNQALLQLLKTNPSMPIAAAIVEAKSGVTDNDVRRTWIFFGDPAMSLQPAPSASWLHYSPTRGKPPIERKPY